jgi:hypothetical protein
LAQAASVSRLAGLVRDRVPPLTRCRARRGNTPQLQILFCVGDAVLDDLQDVSAWRRLATQAAEGLVRDLRRPFIVARKGGSIIPRSPHPDLSRGSRCDLNGLQPKRDRVDSSSVPRSLKATSTRALLLGSLQPQPHDPTCVPSFASVWNIPIARNRATADCLISSPLLDSDYRPLQPDYGALTVEPPTAQHPIPIFSSAEG